MARSDFRIYENICENKRPVDAYSSIMVQAENGYYRGLQFWLGARPVKRGLKDDLSTKLAMTSPNLFVRRKII